MDNNMTPVTPYDCENGKMTVGIVHAHYRQEHLDAVKAEMVKRGAPSIVAIWSDDLGMYVALEGCHRLRAAKALGIDPTLLVVSDWDRSDKIDAYAPGSCDPEHPITIGDVIDGLARSVVLTFESAE